MKLPSNTLSRALYLLIPSLAMTVANGSLNAQETNSVTQTNEVVQGEAADSNDEAGTADDLVMTNQVSESNGVGQVSAPGPDGRTRRLQRQKHSRTHNDSNPQNGSALSRGTNGFGPLDYAAFRLVTERNIFDPNRQPHAGPRSQPTKVQDSFTLVGTMSYDKGDFAFFDGTSSDFKKVLKPDQTIAGYKVVSILPDSVKLEREKKDIDLRVGTQLHRQEDGTWVQASSGGAYAESSGSGSPASSDTTASGGESDVLKRLMQRREKESSP